MRAVRGNTVTSPSGRSARTRRRAVTRTVTAAMITALLPASVALGAGDPCTTGGNPIVCENSKPGADPSEWDISGAGDDSIQGFATDISVDAGHRIDFKIATPATGYTIDIYRTGWYGGKGARKWASVTPDVPLPQIQPECVVDMTTELYDCGNWDVSAHWDVPSDATSGVYVAKLTRTDNGGASHITFVVRDDSSRSDLLFQTSDTTWQAYNFYGGSDYYYGAANGRAYKISYNRPFATRGADNGRSFYFSSEYAMVRFLEQNGYDVSYIAGLDTARSGSLLLNHKTFLSVGHDEYWSGDQRANVEAARDAGVNLAFFSGNEVYWHTRWEGSVAGTPTDHRTLVCYKETWANAKIDPSSQWTGTWRDPRFAGTKDGGGLPENALTGTIYMANDSDLPLTVSSEEGRLRLWRDTDLTALPAGTSQELAPHTVGYESDEDLDNGARPAGLVRLSTTVGDVPHYLQDFGNTVPPGRTTHHVTLYRARSGALVFGAGTIQWAWGLDQHHDGDGAPADPRMRQATMNLLADMGAQPATPAHGLVPTPASTDTAGPTATVASPSDGAKVANGSHVTVSGTATDAGGGQVAGVEVSLDDGASWHPADGRASWSYTGIQHGTGPTRIKVRATDDSANTGPVATVGADVACPCTVFGDTMPPVPSTDDGSAVELGLRFVPKTDGVVEGVRLYKGDGNTGTHTGSLWSATGELLAQVELTEETPTGWQTARFPEPVPVAAGQSYVVSYTAPAGHYANQEAAFASRDVDAAPLTVEGGFGAEPSGVFGAPGTFPHQTFGNSAYFVDVLFDVTDDAPLSASGQAPAPAAVSVPLGTAVSATFSTNVDPATAAVRLADPVGRDVAGTTRYDAVARTVTFTPSAPLAGSVEYTVTLQATTPDGRPLRDGGSWTFRSARPPSDACPCGIFDDTVLPMIPNAADPLAVTLGMRFQARTAGEVQGVRFYKASGSTGPFVVQLWSAGGDLLARAPVTDPVSSGWQEVTFASPVKIAADIVYTVSYRTGSGHYAATPGGLRDQVSRGELSTPESAGTYAYDDVAPATVVSTNYLVDVVYVPDT